IGSTKTKFQEIDEKIESIFFNTVLVWLKDFDAVKEYFQKVGKVKLILLDQDVPGFNGQYLVSEINELSGNSPIVFLSEVPLNGKNYTSVMDKFNLRQRPN
ncbi:hypothetical protein, partial [Christiangramia aquimixticola]